MALKNFSTTPATNQIGTVPEFCPEGWAFSSVNGWGASLMADVRSLAASNTIASAATCDLGSLNETFLTITGTTTITGFGTVSDGIYKFVTFSGALTLTHNATSLILLTGANRTTVAGDCGLYKSEGSGNWREYFYSAQGGYQPLDAQLTTLAGITSQQATDLASLSTFMGTVLNDADAATARATLELATVAQAEAEAGTATTTRTWTAERVKQAIAAQKIKAGTAIASTSGTSIDFTGIPAGTRRIKVLFHDFSLSGTAIPYVRIGDGAIIAAGYKAAAQSFGGTSITSANFTDGFGLNQVGAASIVLHGQLDLVKITGNTWIATGYFGRSDSTAGSGCGGALVLAGELDRVSITTSNGTDTFDLGTVNITYE